MNITEETAQRLNQNIERLLNLLEPTKVVDVKKQAKTDEEKIKAYGDMVVARCAKKHLKQILNPKTK